MQGGYRKHRYRYLHLVRPGTNDRIDVVDQAMRSAVHGLNRLFTDGPVLLHEILDVGPELVIVPDATKATAPPVVQVVLPLAHRELQQLLYVLIDQVFVLDQGDEVDDVA